MELHYGIAFDGNDHFWYGSLYGWYDALEEQWYVYRLGNDEARAAWYRSAYWLYVNNGLIPPVNRRMA